MYTSPVSANNTPFTSSYHVYFYTNDGKRIISDKNMKKCLHYMEAHLNGSKRVKIHNQDLINTMKFGKKLPDGTYSGGDRDYYNIPKIRSITNIAKKDVQGFVNILTGKDAEVVSNTYGKPIGMAKNISKKRTNSTNSFETYHAVKQYYSNVPEYLDSKAVYKNGNRQAFGVCFTPIFNKKGEVKEFQYHHSGFFDENKVR